MTEFDPTDVPRFAVHNPSLRISDHGPVRRYSVRYEIEGIMAPAQVAMYQVGTTLFDAGPPRVAQWLYDQLPHRTIERVIVTHHHEDHVGTLHLFRTLRPDVPLLAPRPCIGLLEPGLPVPKYRQMYWGKLGPISGLQGYDYGQPFDCAGSTVRSLHTPGHTPYHSSFYIRAGDITYVMTGDIYLNTTPLAIFYEADLPGMLHSIETLLTLPGEIVLLLSHGGIPTDGRARLNELAQYLREQIHQIETLAKQMGTRDAKKIASALYGYDPEAWDYSGGEIGPQCFVRGALTPVFELPATVP